MTIIHYIIIINIVHIGIIALLHLNQWLWNKWETMTHQYPKSHYAIGVLNLLITVANIYLFYLLTS